MRAVELTLRSFDAYPPLGRRLAIDHTELLRRCPMALRPSLLAELSTFDWQFPAQQMEVESRLRVLEAEPSLPDLFSAINVPLSVGPGINWVNHPHLYLESLTAYLWSSHQMDRFREISSRFVQQLAAKIPPTTLSTHRLVMVVIGRDAQPSPYPLFERLRPHGQIFTNLQRERTGEVLLDALRKRAGETAAPYSHWYLDGGAPLKLIADEAAPIASLSYPGIAPINRKILSSMQQAFGQGRGPEVLRSHLSSLSPQALDAPMVTPDPRMQRFILSMLTEASGTQFFSTTFVQWTGREILRRAQPLTLLARFGPRQRQATFNRMVELARQANSPSDATSDLDAQGSLIDADMGAWYLYLEMMRLRFSESSRFFAWFEGQSQGILCAPGIVTGGTTTDRALTPAELSLVLAGTKTNT
ncbi:MAG: hypothetical protein JSS95_11865 [Acidobacteria bacterium]|nr:hypothetical protein [Acidobacteriota bacterium]